MSGFSAALENLYASVLQPELLRPFLAQMCELSGSTLGGVMSHDLSHNQGSMHIVHGAEGFDLPRYEREYAAENLWFQRSAHAMRTGAMINTDDFISRREFRTTRYYHDVLHQFDRTEQGLALCADMDEGRVVVMAFNRSGRLPAFSDAQINLFRELLPHWLNAYALQRRLSWLETRVTSMETALDRLRKAMLLFDARGHLVKINEPAESLLRDGSVLARRGDALVARYAPAELTAAIASACGSGTTGKSATVGRLSARLLLRDRAGHASAVADLHSLPLRGDSNGGFAAVMFVQRVGVPAVIDGADVLHALFDLTDAEARLALALHAHASVDKAAEIIGITAGSARTRLKILFHKIGVHSQAALLRLLDAVLV
jgi:DNA-binding CsgD family transcriptional regulator